MIYSIANLLCPADHFRAGAMIFSRQPQRNTERGLERNKFPGVYFKDVAHEFTPIKENA
jgi:hypothetical protein